MKDLETIPAHFIAPVIEIPAKEVTISKHEHTGVYVPPVLSLYDINDTYVHSV